MKEITGNLITLAKEGHFDMIVHGCNCFCTMSKKKKMKPEEKVLEALEAAEYFSAGVRGPFNILKLKYDEGNKVKEINF